MIAGINEWHVKSLVFYGFGCCDWINLHLRRYELYSKVYLQLGLLEVLVSGESLVTKNVVKEFLEVSFVKSTTIIFSLLTFTRFVEFHLLPSTPLVAGWNVPTGSKGWDEGEKINRYRLACSAFLRKVKLKGHSVCSMKLTVPLKDGLKMRMDWRRYDLLRTHVGRSR